MGNFFISRSGEDKVTALIIDDILRRAGHSTFIQDRDFRNASIIAKMAEAFEMVENGAKVIALLSRTYQQKEHCIKEAHYPLVDDPNNKQERLIILRIEDCEPTGLLKDIRYTDLFPFPIYSAEFQRAVLAAVEPPNHTDFSLHVSVPAHVKLNEHELRQPAIEKFSSELIFSPVTETRFINFYDCVEEASWLSGSGIVQTTSVEFKEVWADPRYFVAYEASLLVFKNKGLDVHRLFILNPEVQASENYRREFQRVIFRHELLGLKPRVIVRPDALIINKAVGVNCDAFAIVDMSAMLLVKIHSGRSGIIAGLSAYEPIAIKTTNKSLCTRASNVFHSYWADAKKAEFLQHQWGALPKEYAVSIEEEARQIEKYCSFYVDRDSY